MNLLLAAVQQHLVHNPDLGQEVIVKVWMRLTGLDQRDPFNYKGPGSFSRWVNTLSALERRTLLKVKTLELERRVFVEDDEETEDGQHFSADEKLAILSYHRSPQAHVNIPMQLRMGELHTHPSEFIRRYAALALDELNQSEIAKVMGISESDLSRRLKALRENPELLQNIPREWEPKRRKKRKPVTKPAPFLAYRATAETQGMCGGPAMLPGFPVWEVVGRSHIGQSPGHPSW